MISFRQTNQGGSVQTFFIIGLLLVIVTIGVARFVEQHGAQVRRDQAISQAEKQAKTDLASSNSSSTNTESSGANSGEVAVPASSDNTSTTPTTTTGTETQSSVLPTTGPSGMTILNIILIGLLSAAIAAYLASRRMLARSL